MTQEEFWEEKKHLLKLALDGCYTLEDVWDEIENNRAQFWPMPNSAVVTQVLEFPRKRVLRIWLAGGELHELRRAIAHAEEYALHRGCTEVEIDGRKGWARALNGFTETRRVLTKEVI